LLRDFGAEKIRDTVSISSAEDVAYAIVRGAALRQRSVYYPYSYSFAATVYHFLPCLFEKAAAALYVRN